MLDVAVVGAGPAGLAAAAALLQSRSKPLRVEVRKHYLLFKQHRVMYERLSDPPSSRVDSRHHNCAAADQVAQHLQLGSGGIC